MIRGVLGGLALWAVSATGLAQPVDVSERRWFQVTLTPPAAAESGAYVGGELILHVQFVSSDPLKRVRLDLPVIRGARSTVLVRAQTRKVQIVDDDGYSTLESQKYSHETRLALVPEQGGTLVIPPITVTGIAELADRQTVEFEETHPEQVLVVHPADPELIGGPWVVSQQATLRDSWSRDAIDIRNGDTVRRTVTLRAVGLTADDLTPFHLQARAGHRVIHTEVATRTEQTDHGFIAHLEQSWDIYFDTEDATHVDGVTFRYWNPELGRPEAATLATRRIEPLKRDAAALRDSLRADALARHQARRLGLWGLASVPAAGLTTLALLVLWRMLPTRADWRLWQASRRGSTPLDFYRAFLAWGRHTFGSGPVVGRAETATLGARAAVQVRHLHTSVFGAGGGSPPLPAIAAALILGSRWRALRRLLRALIPGAARFLFLR